MLGEGDQDALQGQQAAHRVADPRIIIDDQDPRPSPAGAIREQRELRDDVGILPAQRHQKSKFGARSGP